MAPVRVMTRMKNIISAVSPAKPQVTRPDSRAAKLEKSKSTATNYIEEILRCYAVLSSASSLAPSETINEAFSTLVSISILILDESTTYQILNHPKILKITPHLRSLCSSGEGLLESLWAQKIAHPDPTQPSRLKDFPYSGNYDDLTTLELNLIKTANLNPRKFVFLGCGPLPLTSFCIVDQLAQPDVEILNVDLSLLAIVEATALAKQVGYSPEKMAFCCDSAGGSKHSLKQADVVYLAALVGSTGIEKKEVLRNVVDGMKSGGLIVIRTAWGLRKLLYPELLIPEDVSVPGLEILTVVHPYNSIVNSVILGRVR